MTQWSNSALNRVHNLLRLLGGFKYMRPTECLADAHFNVFWWDLLFMASLYSNSIPDCGSHSPHSELNMVSWHDAFILLLFKSYSWCSSAGSVGGFGFVSEQCEEPYSWWWDQLIKTPLGLNSTSVDPQIWWSISYTADLQKQFWLMLNELIRIVSLDWCAIVKSHTLSFQS